MKVESGAGPWFKDVSRMLASLQCGVAVRDAGNRLLLVNDQLREWLGYALGELEGSPVERLYPPENVALLHAEMAAAEAGGDLRARLTVLWRKVGTVLPVLILPQPVHDETGRVIGGIGVIIELSTVQTARAAGYRAGEGRRRERLDRIAFEIQSLGPAAGHRQLGGRCCIVNWRGGVRRPHRPGRPGGRGRAAWPGKRRPEHPSATPVRPGNIAPQATRRRRGSVPRVDPLTMQQRPPG